MYCLHLCTCELLGPTYHVAWCHNPCDHSLNTYCHENLRNFIGVELETKLLKTDVNLNSEGLCFILLTVSEFNSLKLQHTVFSMLIRSVNK
jgi:hypothetical protein